MSTIHLKVKRRNMPSEAKRAGKRGCDHRRVLFDVKRGGRLRVYHATKGWRVYAE